MENRMYRNFWSRTETIQMKALKNIEKYLDFLHGNMYSNK